MDGPNTNWSFLKKMCDSRDLDPDLPSLISVGSCDLHTVHGAFKHGAHASGWEIDGILRSIFYCFHESPARREDFQKYTGSSAYPKKFCSTGWIEDVSVAETAIRLWPQIEKYVRTVLSGPKSQVLKNESFRKLSEYIRDGLVISKLHAFTSLAKLMKPFLESYQSPRPLLPFMAEDLYVLCKDLMSKFVKDQVLQKVENAAQLLRIDVHKAENLKPVQKIEVGFAVRPHLETAEKNKKTTPLQILDFYRGFQMFLQGAVTKLLEKSPIKYPLVRNMQAINPVYLINNPESGRFHKILDTLLSHRLLSADTCDEVMKQFKVFLAEVKSHLSAEFQEGIWLSGCILLW